MSLFYSRSDSWFCFIKYSLLSFAYKAFSPFFLFLTFLIGYSFLNVKTDYLVKVQILIFSQSICLDTSGFCQPLGCRFLLKQMN